MKPLVSALTRILRWICVVLFAALIVIVVWQVIARQVLNSPAAWTEEASRMTFVWVGLFAAAMVFGERGHIAVDFIVQKFGPAAHKTVGIVVQCLIIFFALSMMVYGGVRASNGASNQRLAALSFLTLGQMYWVLPITGVLITLFAVGHIQAILASTEPPFPASEEEQLLEEMAAEGVLPAVPDAPGSATHGKASDITRNLKEG